MIPYLANMVCVLLNLPENLLEIMSEKFSAPTALYDDVLMAFHRISN
jgi:hypothetical protein